jgi:hypothetical protein
MLSSGVGQNHINPVYIQYICGEITKYTVILGVYIYGPGQPYSQAMLHSKAVLHALPR